jgi:putative Holliday junction resolvase
VAVSDPTGTLARPLEPLERGSRVDDFEAVAALVAAYDVVAIVVGQPLNLGGAEGQQARRIARYAEAMATRLSMDIVLWDESLTTVAAEDIMRQNRSEKRRRRARGNGELDSIAAAVILQSYLDSQYRDDRPPQDDRTVRDEG